MADDPYAGIASEAGSDPYAGIASEKPSRKAAGREEPKSVIRDVIEQIPQGFNRGIDATYNLPNNLLNFAARQLGYGQVVEPVKLATRFNYENDQPQTAAGRYAGAISEQLGANALGAGGMIGAADLPVAGANALRTGLNTLYSSIGGGVAGEAAKDLGGNALTQTAASIGGSLSGPNAINALLSRGPADPRLIEKTLAAQAAQQEGIDVPRIAVADSLVKPVGGRLAAIPAVGSPIQNAARSALDQTGERVAQIASDYGQGNRATAGANLRDELADYIGTGSRKPINRLYDKVDALVDDTAPQQMPATQALAQRLMSERSSTVRATNEQALSPIMDDLSAQNLTYSDIKKIRTTVGAMLDDSLLPNAGTSKPILKQIYGALTNDLKDAVENAGQPGALDAFNKATRMADLASDRREMLAKIIGKSGGNAGENVFETMAQMAQDKGKSANIEALTRARRSVDSDTWNDMTSAFVRRMGVNPQTGDFSPDRFLTTYGKLSPEGKQVMFNSTNRADLAQSLDRLADVSKQFSELYKMGNPSGTGGTNVVAGLLGLGAGGVLGIPTAAAGAVGSYGLAKAFASPANVDRMTRTLQARLAYQGNPNPSTKARYFNAVAALSAELQDQSQPVHQR